MKNIITFKGKRIEDMNREELIDALSWSANELLNAYQSNKRERDFIFSLFSESSIGENVNKDNDYISFGESLFVKGELKEMWAHAVADPFFWLCIISLFILLLILQLPT